MQIIKETRQITVDRELGHDLERRSLNDPFKTVQAAFESVRSGDSVFILPGTYMLRPGYAPDQGAVNLAGLTLRDIEDVKIVGLGLPTLLLATEGHGLVIDNGNRIGITGLRFKGTGPKMTPNDLYTAMILLHGKNDSIWVSACHFEDGANHGIAHLWGPRTSNNCLISGNRFERGGNFSRNGDLSADGAAVAIGGSGNLFEGNWAKDWLRTFEIEANGGPVDATCVQIRGNTIIGSAWQSILVTATSGEVEKFRDIIISGNIIRGTGQPVGRFSNTGILVSGATGIQVSNNTISDIANGIGILLITNHGRLTRSQVSGNKIVNAGRTGIHYGPGTAGILPSLGMIENNQIVACGGIGLDVNGSNTMVSNNQISGCAYAGARIKGRQNMACHNMMIGNQPKVDDSGTETGQFIFEDSDLTNAANLSNFSAS